MAMANVSPEMIGPDLAIVVETTAFTVLGSVDGRSSSIWSPAGRALEAGTRLGPDAGQEVDALGLGDGHRIGDEVLAEHPLAVGVPLRGVLPSPRLGGVGGEERGEGGAYGG